MPTLYGNSQKLRNVYCPRYDCSSEIVYSRLCICKQLQQNCYGRPQELDVKFTITYYSTNHVRKRGQQFYPDSSSGG